MVNMIELHLNNISGKVYKIKEIDLDDILYIGSTKRDLKTRLREHCSEIRIGRSKIKNIKNKKLEIIELENVVGNDTTDLRFRERYWCEKLQPKYNMIKPIRSRGEYNKTYYAMNRTKLLQNKREKVNCEKCGVVLARRSLWKHMKSNRCKKNCEANLKKKENNIDDNIRNLVIFFLSKLEKIIISLIKKKILSNNK